MFFGRPVFWFSNMFVLQASILIFQYLFWRPVFWFDVYFEFWWFQAGEVPVGLLRPRCPLHHHLMVFMIVKSVKHWPHHPLEDHGYCHPLQVLLPPAPRLLPCSHCSPCHRLPLPGKDWDFLILILILIIILIFCSVMSLYQPGKGEEVSLIIWSWLWFWIWTFFKCTMNMMMTFFILDWNLQWCYTGDTKC